MMAMAALLIAAAGVAQGTAQGAAQGTAAWRESPLHDPVSLYRIARPRSPVPLPPEGVAAIDTAAVARLGGRVLLVDVSPVEDGRRDAASGRWTLRAPARSLPGAVWFPEAGRVPGDAAIIDQFTAQVPKLAAGRPIVVFCLADCWMSWNAALRLHRMGLPVQWYGAGRDGWRAAGRQLAPVAPFSPEG